MDRSYPKLPNNGVEQPAQESVAGHWNIQQWLGGHGSEGGCRGELDPGWEFGAGDLGITQTLRILYLLTVGYRTTTKSCTGNREIQGSCDSEVVQSCPTLWDPMDCSLPGSFVHGIFQARIGSGLPFPSPGDLSNPGTEPRSATSEPPGKSLWGRRIVFFSASELKRPKPIFPIIYPWCNAVNFTEWWIALLNFHFLLYFFIC